MKDSQARRVYGDIIDLPHHQSSRHPHMSLYDRAAQFAPFAALTGYSDMVAEEARLTEGKPELSEDEREHLDRSIAFLRALLASGEHPQVQVVYFVPDERKSGGKLEAVSGRVKRLDMARRRLVLLAENGISDGASVPVDEVTQILSQEMEGMDALD